MRVAALVVSWNGGDLLEDCVGAIVGQEPGADLVVVDNASTDGSREVLRRLGRRSGRKGFELIERAANEGFTRAANIGMDALLARAEAPDIILLVNQDLVLDAGAGAALAEVFESEPKAAAVGCKILYPDRATIQHAGGRIERPRMLGLHHGHHEPASSRAHNRRREVDFVTGAAMALRVAALREVGLFDEIFSPGYFEDVELCQRLRASGWKVLYTPAAVAHHAESASFSNWHERWALSHRNRFIFALPELVDESFRVEFAAAERAFVAAAEGVDQAHALAQACFRMLIDFDRVLRARAPEAAADPEVVAALSGLFADLRNACVDAVHRRLAPSPRTG